MAIMKEWPKHIRASFEGPKWTVVALLTFFICCCLRFHFLCHCCCLCHQLFCVLWFPLDRRNHGTQDHQNRHWCLAEYLSSWCLVWLIWKNILRCQGLTPSAITHWNLIYSNCQNKVICSYFLYNLYKFVLVSYYIVYLYARNSCKYATVCITTY